MNKIIILALAFCFAVATLHATDVTPKDVQSAFHNKFPSVKDVKWGKENAHEYEAEFMLDGIKATANFSDDGKWIETETEIGFEKLPIAVQTAFQKMHGKQKDLHAAKIETATQSILFELEFRNGTKNDEVFFSEDGKMIEQKKKLSEKDEEEEEDEDDDEEGND